MYLLFFFVWYIKKLIIPTLFNAYIKKITVQNLYRYIYSILDKNSQKYTMGFMNLTTKGKYAVLALLDLTLNESRFCYVSLSEVAKRQNIPAPYLEQLFRNLRKAGILEAARGPKGGFRLARGSSDINIAEVVLAVEKITNDDKCEGKGECEAGAHDLWTSLNEEVNNFLVNKSLNDVLKSQQFQQNLTKQALIATG